MNWGSLCQQALPMHSAGLSSMLCELAGITFRRSQVEGSARHLLAQRLQGYWPGCCARGRSVVSDV